MSNSRNWKSLLAALVVLVAAAPIFAEEQIEILWNSSPANVKVTKRVVTGEPVSLHVSAFNFMAYDLTETVEERKIEAYVWLEKLWSQILGPLAGDVGVAGQEKGPLEAALIAWLANLTETEQLLTGSLTKFEPLGSAFKNQEQLWLKDESSGVLTLDRANARIEKLAELERAALGVLGTAQSFAEIEWFNRIAAVDSKVGERLAAYASAAKACLDGRTILVTGKKAGTIVTVTLEAKKHSSSSSEKAVSVEYFVQSKWPLVYQIGYAFSSLDDVEFEKVRTANSQDLFSEVEGDELQGLVGLLGYEISRWSEARSLLVNLGTDADKPGENLYLSLGLRWNRRLALHAGVMSAVVQEGANPVLEEVAGALNARELFTTVSNTRDWGGFFAVAFVVAE